MCVGPGTHAVSSIEPLNGCALIQKQPLLTLCNLLELLCIPYSVWQLLLCVCSCSLYTHLNSFAVEPACISLTDKLYVFLLLSRVFIFHALWIWKDFFFYKLFLYWPSVFERAISLTGAVHKPCGINPFFHTKSKLKSPQHFHKTELVLFRLLSTEMCACPVGGAVHFHRKCSFLPPCWLISLSSPVLHLKSIGRAPWDVALSQAAKHKWEIDMGSVGST